MEPWNRRTTAHIPDESKIHSGHFDLTFHMQFSKEMDSLDKANSIERILVVEKVFEMITVVHV